jgi:hypothetical protein
VLNALLDVCSTAIISLSVAVEGIKTGPGTCVGVNPVKKLLLINPDGCKSKVWLPFPTSEDGLGRWVPHFGMRLQVGLLGLLTSEVLVSSLWWSD